MHKNQVIIGRIEEKKRLDHIIKSQRAEFIAIYGRRRIGKTFLIREYFKDKVDINFYVMGLNKGTTAQQLSLFQSQMEDTFYAGAPLPKFNSWKHALDLLVACLKVECQRKPLQNILIFLDELPWLATRKSGLLEALDHCWNTELKDLPFVKLVVCGSAATWMIKKIVNAKGGLHNRLTDVLHIKPFSLKETQEFLDAKGMSYQLRQVVDLYLAVGGIPYYLELVRPGFSPAQNIAQLFFSSSPLTNEFENLFSALFADGEHHTHIVKALSTKKKGLSRDEIIKLTKLPSGGKLTTWLEELKEAGFIEILQPYGKKTKQTHYRIIDEYLLFYFKWIQNAPKNSLLGDGLIYWQNQASSQSYNSWAGYAFENLCIKHNYAIRKSLGFSAVNAEVGPWQWIPKKGSKQTGVQIDLVFDRADKIITLCEMKYYDTQFSISKAYNEELKTKKRIFIEKTGTKKSILFALVTTEGLIENEYSQGMIQSVVTIEDLFRHS